jgi:hypothetical protein
MGKQVILDTLAEVLAIAEQIATGDIALNEVQPALMEASDMLSAAIGDVEEQLTDNSGTETPDDSAKQLQS